MRVNPPKFEDAPGLVLRRRKIGWAAVWQARTDLVKRGYDIKSRAIATFADEPSRFDRAMVSDRCNVLQGRMLMWARDNAVEDPDDETPVPGPDVYFASDHYAIKIGFSGFPPRRLIELQTDHGFGQHLFLLGSFPAAKEVEAQLHQRFKHLWIDGEWFEPAPELIGFIDGLHAAGVLREYV